MLKRRGILRVRPLAGGLDAWIEVGYPVLPLERTVGGAGAASTD